jgi:flagellar biosynthesis protein FliQ
MSTDQVVVFGRMILEEAIILAGPILMVAISVSLLVNIVQVLTSMQDHTIGTVTRLLATGSALFVAMPWMWKHLAHFTVNTFSDFHPYLQ